jgi:hypothetical protein
MSFGADHYVPVLKTKQGERQALGQISSHLKARLTPILEFDDLPEDPDTGIPTRDLDHHCELILPSLVSGWGTTSQFFLDVGTMVDYASLNGVFGPVYVMDESASAGLQFIPVVGLRRPLTEIGAAIAHGGNGLCLRLTDEDLASLSISADLSRFLSEHHLVYENIDLVVDLASIFGSPAGRVQALSTSYLLALPYIHKWRTLTIAASAFPQNMGVLSRQTSATFERIEWTSWNALYNQRRALPRLPTFGDYGIQHPVIMEGFDPRYMAASAAIRYTLDREWLLVKGQSTRRMSGTAQYQALAAYLLQRPEYMTPSHCSGCHDIELCSQGAAGFGSATPWRRIGTVHHLTHAATQISGLVFP